MSARRDKLLAIVDRLPEGPGVYLFRGRTGDVLYVGKAANLRSRVRSYFSTDERRKIGQLLRETHRIDHQVCRNGLEAAVLELRLIHEHLPRFNRQHTRSSKYPYVKLTLEERFPRLSVVRKLQDDGALFIGAGLFLDRGNLLFQHGDAIQLFLPLGFSSSDRSQTLLFAALCLFSGQAFGFCASARFLCLALSLLA